MKGKCVFQTRMSWVSAVLVALVLLITSSQAHAGAMYYGYYNYFKNGDWVYANFEGSDDTRVNYQSASGTVGSAWTLSPGESIAFVGGHADAGSLSLGAYAQVVSTPENGRFSDTRISAEASNRLTILPGSSGLSMGDVTQLLIKVRVDGSLQSEATSYPGKSWAHADMSANLTVHDYEIQIDTGEGTWSPALASFGASSSLESYDVYKPVWNYSYAADWDKSWNFESNMIDRDSYGNSGRTKETGDGYHYPAGFSVDTGEITIAFEAIVGHTLDFNAGMNIYANANNDGLIYADFNNTMAFDVTSADGVSLNWQVVPEPATLTLLALGTLALRRRK